MEYIILNLLPIAAATAASFAFGAGWYMLLSKPWMGAAGLTEDRIKGAKRPWLPFLIAFLAEFWIAAVMAGALILAPPEAGAWTMAFGTALILWSSFVMPTMIVNHRYQMLPWRLTFIDGGHWLGVFLLQVAVLQGLGLKAPPGA
ncbi:DUF1761 domain-containing protein [Parvularcula maris]|uniref:DUF1761 domain-containing protein n=1 Tax=Parvularcula maris TaxID=2965077 RepID=A0A9X2LA80_9PROT|nr:DUF1761 domain-containing protein [Parvularcula maris]MCQ8185907.1 DUF1761 domain-containing protein [Parvularcula maris]